MSAPAWLLAATVLGLAFTPGQETREQPPTFKSGVDLVRLDVRIIDASGRPITDLRPEELEIRDGRELLPLLLFQRVSEPAGTYVDAAMRAVTAEVSSNEAFPRGHLYILIFDQQHITPGNEQKARLAAEDFIRQHVRPADRIALFAVPGPGPQIGFTADKLRAIEQLASIRGMYQRIASMPMGTMSIYEAHRILEGDERLTTAVANRIAADLVGDVQLRTPVSRAATFAPEDAATTQRLIRENASTIVNQSDSDSRQFLQRLADVISGFRDIDGRKTVVLFTEGFFQQNLTRELESVAAAAAQTYAVFYPFDLNQRASALSEASAPDTALGGEIQARIAPLATLAIETDGMLVLDASGRSDRALKAIAEQAQDYYLVGFAPAQEARLNRGKYRRIEIKVKRPGARVSARTGYTLAPETTIADRRRAIDRVLGAPFSQQGLKLDYTTYVMKSADAEGHRVVLSLTTDLPLRSKPGDMADVVFVARDVRDGRVVASGTDTIPLPAKARTGSPLGSAAWRVQFNVPAGTFMMRTVVREPGGLVGSADRRIDVRPLDGPEVAVSDLLIGSTMGALPVRPRVYAGDGLSGVIETYARTMTQMEGLEVRIQLKKPGEEGAVKSFGADLLEADDKTQGLIRRARFMMPIGDVPPGDYVAHATVRVRGEVVAERTRQVEVLASRDSSSAAETQPAGDSVAPAEIVRGDLGRRYVAALFANARGTDVAEAARLAQVGRWEEVELALRRTKDQTGLMSQSLRGLALFAREDYRGATAALQLAFEADPKNALTAFFLGWAQDGAGDTRAALSAWRSAAHLDPSLVSAHIALADAYLRLSQRALAIQALRAGLAALPASTELRERLAQLEKPGVPETSNVELSTTN